MEAIKLQSMTDFVLKYLDSGYSQDDALKNNILMLRYAKFLNQPLQLGFFVPTDLEGNILEEPSESDFDNFDLNEGGQVVDYERYNSACDDYFDAQEKVLFKGFEFKEYERMICFDKKGIEIFIYSKNYQTFSAPRGKISTIEDLIIYEFELSETAIKQIGLNYEK